jgi:hypothetical protein
MMTLKEYLQADGARHDAVSADVRQRVVRSVH